MKKSIILTGGLSLLALASCANSTDSKTITVCCSSLPHEQILVNAVKPLLEKQGYKLKTTVLDWTLQNDAVKSKEYDANYFQHRPYLQSWETGDSNYNAEYEYKTLFPAAAVHFEPLRIYAGKKTASQFAAEKTTSTYVICNDGTNETRALDLLVKSGVISSYSTDSKGSPINLPSNIKAVSEETLAVSLADYDYGVLPTNTALTGNIAGDDLLPVEGDEVADLRANVIVARVEDYATDSIYNAKIKALVEASLDSSIAAYITTTWNNVIAAYQKDQLAK